MCSSTPPRAQFCLVEVFSIPLVFPAQEIEHKQMEVGFMLQLFPNISIMFLKQAL